MVTDGAVRYNVGEDTPADGLAYFKKLMRRKKVLYKGYFYPLVKAAVLDASGKWGFIDRTGKEVVSCKYDEVENFSDGLAVVRQNGKYGYIDRAGNLVIPCKYDNAWEFSDGSAPVMQNGKWGYIDKNGKAIVPCKYDDAGIVSDGMARVAERQSAKVSGKDVTLYLYGYLSISGGEEQVSSWAKEQVSRAAAGDSPFSDISAPAVIQAAELGFVGGVGDGKFDPDALVTREQTAVMLSRVYTKLGGEIPKVDKTSFADDASIGSYAKDAVAFMSSQEIVSGTGNNQFNPKGNASIEQVLVIALRMFEKLK